MFDVRKLIGETTEYDKKQSLESRKPKSWLKSVSAFANGEGRALIFGIADDGNVTGLDNAERDAETISEQIKSRMEPIPEFNLKFEMADDKTLIILRVNKGNETPYYITKKEWILDGATVTYGSASELEATLEYDISQGKKYSYKGLSMDEIIHHVAVFVAGLWQIHVFGEGNTRTTAVFFIKYLRTLGFDVTNDIFAQNAWYFRNALVRANYNDLVKGVHETTEYLELFLKNLLLGEKNELHNRTLGVQTGH